MRSRSDRSRVGKSFEVRTQLSLQNGADHGRRLTPALRARAPLPPLPLAGTPLAQPRAAAAATPAAVIPVAHPHRTCQPSPQEPRQRRPAPESQQAWPRPNGAGPVRGHTFRPDYGQGAGRSPVPFPRPAPSGSRSQWESGKRAELCGTGTLPWRGRGLQWRGELGRGQCRGLGQFRVEREGR